MFGDNEIMNFKEFMKIMLARFKACEELIATKSAEYNEGEDKFHNFVVQAKIGRCTVGEAMKGNALKHFASIFDMIESVESKFDDVELPSEAMINEKFTDAINYLTMMEAWIRLEKQRKYLLKVLE